MDAQQPSSPIPAPPLTPERRAQLLMERGLALYGRGDVVDAVRHWLAACQSDPRNGRAAGYIAFATEHDGIDPSELRFDSSLLRLDPDPIGPPRTNDVPDYIPNPPRTADLLGELSTSARLEASETAPIKASYSPRAPEAPLHADPEVAAALVRLREHLGADDFSGALEEAELILVREPNLAEATVGRRKAAENLMRMFESKVGDLLAVPVLRIPADEVIWLNLNPREGFILSQVDGILRFEDILDVCGMPRLEALRVLANLVSDKVIAPAS